MANGTIKKGSLVKNTGGSGGGGSSFPTTVTSSGSSLPATTGFQVGDTFLNTSDKKLYTLESSVDGYKLSEGVSNGITVDLQTGIASGWTRTGSGPYYYQNISKAASNIGWKGSNKVFKIHFKLTSSPQANQNYVLYSEYTQYASNDCYMSIRVSNKKLNLKINRRYMGSDSLLEEKDLCLTELSTEVEYYLTVTKNGTSASVVLATNGYDGAIVEENTIETQDLYGDVTITRSVCGYSAENGTININGGSQFTVGEIYLADSIGNFVEENIVISWDSGTDITDKTEYADKTNGILYLYEDTELVQIPLIDLSNYKLKATTTTIDTASVTVSEIKANTNYVFSNNAITDITLSGCETSFEETTIEFTTGSTAPTLTDNSGITWVDGSSPSLNASKSYIIVIFNKLGFVKEY